MVSVAEEDFYMDLYEDFTRKLKKEKDKATSR